MLHVEVTDSGGDGRVQGRLSYNYLLSMELDRSLHFPESLLLNLQNERKANNSVDLTGLCGGANGIMYMKVHFVNVKLLNKC